MDTERLSTEDIEKEIQLRERKIPAKLSITSYFHCRKCIEEKPDHLSPREWGSYEVGYSKLGVQVWCKRHKCNIIHIDFGGIKHIANPLTEETERQIKKRRRN